MEESIQFQRFIQEKVTVFSAYKRTILKITISVSMNHKWLIQRVNKRTIIRVKKWEKLMKSAI